MKSTTQAVIGLFVLTICSTANAMERRSSEFKRANRLGQAQAEDSWNIMFCGAKLSFFTPGTTARVLIGGEGGFHAAVLVEGPLRFAGKPYKYLLVHYMPSGIRLEGDDDLELLERLVLHCGSATKIWRGDKHVINPRETPANLFTDKVCEVILASDEEPKFDMARTQRNLERIPMLGTVACTAVTRWNIQQARGLPGAIDQAAAASAIEQHTRRYGRKGDSENYMNCLRFVNMLCFYYKLKLPRELLRLVSL